MDNYSWGKEKPETFLVLEDMSDGHFSQDSYDMLSYCHHLRVMNPLTGVVQFVCSGMMIVVI